MKTRSLVQTSEKGIKPFFALAALLILLLATQRAPGASAAELLEKGIYTEETKGALTAATEIYRQIVEDAGADRSVVAQAQLRLGLCELKLGHKPQAISALERLTRDFPDKHTLLALVEPHMPQVLDDILKQIEQKYIKEVDRSELMETALRAIAGKLDSAGGLLRTNDMELLGTNEVADLNLNLEQKLGGIGAALKWDETQDALIVTSVLPNSPALKGGLLDGDRILQINGKELPPTNSLQRAIKLLRGEPGSPVTVSVKREDSEPLLEIQLVRDVVRLSSVLGDQHKPDGSWDYMWDAGKGIGYIRLTYLGKLSPEEIKTALDDLTARGLRALILDLRNNPGGSLAEAVSVADLFVEAGRIVTVKSRSGEQAYDAKLEGTFSGFPMVVLVNRSTASAAEIIASCLQDHHRATIVGERTFGQGIVRSIIPLQGGVGALKLPVAVYYRPNGKEMNRYPGSVDSDDWGVSPDAGFEVTLQDEEWQQAMIRRSARDKSNTPIAPKQTNPDRQMQKALECLLAPLERR